MVIFLIFYTIKIKRVCHIFFSLSRLQFTPDDVRFTIFPPAEEMIRRTQLHGRFLLNIRSCYTSRRKYTSAVTPGQRSFTRYTVVYIYSDFARIIRPRKRHERQSTGLHRNPTVSMISDKNNRAKVCVLYNSSYILND